MTTTCVQGIMQRLLPDKPSFHLSRQARWDCLPGTVGEIRASMSRNTSTVEIGVGISAVAFASGGVNRAAISPGRDEREHRDRMINMMFIDAVPRIGIPRQLMP